MTITTDGIEKWNLETLDTVFEVATERAARKADFGATLDAAGNGLKDWEGKGGDAFRQELGKHRVDITDQQSEATAIANVFSNARAEVAACKTEWSSIKSAAASNNWAISPTGQLSGQVSSNKRNDFDTLQRRLTKLMADADTTDRDLATAVRAVVGDTKVDAQGHELPRDVGSQERPGVTDVNDPGVQWRPEFDPNKWKESWRNPMIADNPPGYTGGKEGRDQAWRDYLAHYPNQKDPVTGQIPRGYLPNPDAVNDPNLKVLGNAGQQLGTSYAWGGNRSTTGPYKGHGDDGGSATKYGDENRVGFDCGGLVRYSVAQGTGNDPFINNGTSGAGTDLIDTSKHLTPIPAPGGTPVAQYARPGDVVVFGNTGHDPFEGEWTTHHTGIYAGNGVIINAPQSGLPVQLDLLSNWSGDPTDVLRPTP